MDLAARHETRWLTHPVILGANGRSDALDLVKYKGSALLLGISGPTTGTAVAYYADHAPAAVGPWTAVPADSLYNMTYGVFGQLATDTPAGWNRQKVRLRLERLQRWLSVRWVFVGGGNTVCGWRLVACPVGMPAVPIVGNDP